MLLEAWRDFEREDGDEKSQAEVQLLIDYPSCICISPNRRLLLKVSQIEFQPFIGVVTSISLSSQVH